MIYHRDKYDTPNPALSSHVLARALGWEEKFWGRVASILKIIEGLLGGTENCFHASASSTRS